MYRSLKLSQTLTRVATCLQPSQTWPARQVMHRESKPVWSLLHARWRKHGEGEGKGGGGGGAIRRAGGAFGKKEAADEEMYFREKTAHELRDLKKGMRESLTQQLQQHNKELENHKQCLKQHLEELAKDGSTEQHQWHINHHEQSIKYEQLQIDKINETWKKFHLD